MNRLFSVVSLSALVTTIVQPVLAQTQTRITQVQVEATADGGLTISLDAGFELPSGQQTPLNETTLAIDFPNTQLNLVGGEQFIRNNPTPDIAAVRVFPLDDRTVRVEVVGNDGQPDISLKPAPTSLTVTVLPAPIQEFTIISTRRPTPVTETPASVETVTEEELNRRRALIRNTGDAIQTVPGVTLNRLGPITSSANIRGVTGERIGLLVNGNRQPNLEFGPDLGSIDPFRIERIEVLKGPASSLYGADAFGGVVNVITTTPRPNREFGVRSYFYGGGFAEFNGNLEVAGSNYVLGLAARTGGDAEDGDGNDIALGTDYEVFNAYAAGGIDFSDRDRLEIRGELFRQNDADLSGFTAPFTRAESDFRNTDRFSLNYTRKGATEVELEGYYLRSDRRFDSTQEITRPFPIATGMGPPILVPGVQINDNQQDILTETFGFSAQGTSNLLSEDLTLTYGYDFSRDAQTSQTYTETDFVLFEPTIPPPASEVSASDPPLGTRTFNGVFLQSTFDAIADLTLAGGIRFDLFDTESGGDERDDSAVTFNAGLVYELTDNLAARAYFAQGFRPPTLQDLFAEDSFAPTRGFVRSNPDLDPERANNFDIGLNFDNGSLNGGVTYFRNDISDFVGVAPLTTAGPTGSPTLQTANKDILIQGVEFSLGYQLSPQWSIEGNLAIADSEDESGQPLSQLEDFPTTALVRLLYEGDRFSSFLQTRIYDDQGEVLLTDGIVGEGTEGAFAVDLGLGYKLTPTQELTLSVENLFDTDYFYPTSTAKAPGIRALVGLRSQF
ncbi:MAG: TonB-dependent receptor [Cyanobacteria bacterium P01_G01_bin.19]